MTGDTELLRQYAETRSEAAFTELVRRHVDFVYAVALRHARSTHRAEDATQAVFTDLARKAASVGQRAELVGWLYTSARFAAFKIVRSEARRERREREAEMMPADLGVTDPAEADWQALRPHLDDALCGLSDKDRSAVLLRCVNSRSFAEVGAELALSEDAARKRVDRALDRLRVRLARRGIASTAGAVLVALGAQSAVAAPPSLAAAVSHTALGAGASAPLLPALIHLMSTSKIVATLAVLTGAVVITAAWRETQAAHLALARQAEADQGYHRVLEALGRSRGDARKAEKENADLAAALAGRQSLDRAAAAVAASHQPADEAKAARLREVGTAYMRNGIRMDAFAFAKFLNLTPDQVDALTDIETSYFNVMVNGVAVPGNPPEAEREGVRKIVALLGRQNALQLRAASHALPYLKMTSDLASNLNASDPLGDSQAQQLTALLTRSQVDTQPEAWPSALAAASQTLSASQLAVLKTYASSKTGVQYFGETKP